MIKTENYSGGMPTDFPEWISYVTLIAKSVYCDMFGVQYMYTLNSITDYLLVCIIRSVQIIL